MIEKGRKKNRIKGRLGRRTALVLVLLLLLESTFASAGTLTGKSGDDTGAHIAGANEAALCGYQDIDFGFTEEESALPKEPAQGGISVFSLLDEPTAETEAEEEALPAFYGGEEVISALPALRDQNPYGCCWAFSALGACEASLIRKGLSDNSIDLSERQLAYYFFYKGEDTADPLGGTLGDYNTNITSKNYLKAGGNSLLTIWHLASWCGPVDEKKAPYSGLTSQAVDLGGLMGEANSTQAAYGDDAYHLQNAYVIPIGKSYENEEQRNVIKRLILQYGGLGMSYYAASTESGKDYRLYDNIENDCYFYDDYTGTTAGGEKICSTNHAIMVVGWDDNFPKENFNTDHQPDGDGAWLMRNSWGAEGGSKAQNGYFWLSYYDHSLRDYTGSTKYAYVFDCEPADHYDHIYQHDGDAGHRRLGKYKEGGSTFTFSSVRMAANVFTARGREGSQERLDAVGIGVSTVGTAYTVRIYLEPTDESPSSGTLVCEQSGSLAYNGYHTIALEEPVFLDNGQRYAVVFDFPAGASVYASMSFDASGTWRFVANNAAGQSFARVGSGAWLDCAQNETYEPCALRIKAYTTDTDNENGAVTPSPLPTPSPTPTVSPTPTASPTPDTTPTPTPEVSPTPGTTPTPTPEVSPTPGTTPTPTPGVSPTPGTTPTPTPGASPTPGTTPTPTPGSTPSPGISPTPGVAEKPDITPAVLTGLSLSRAELGMTAGDVYELIATPTYDRDNATDWLVYWRSSDAQIAAVNHCGRVTAKKPGRAVITVYAGDVKADCVVTVLPKKVKVGNVCIKNGKLAFQITSQSGVDGYTLYRSTSQNGKLQSVKQLSASGKVSFAVSVGKAGKSYYYALRAYKKVDGKKLYGAYSEVFTAAPDTVSGVSGRQAAKCAVTMSWKKAGHASAYVVYRSAKENGTYRAIGTVAALGRLCLTDRSVKKGKTYYYRVAACRKIGSDRICGALSKAVKVTVKKNGSLTIGR